MAEQAGMDRHIEEVPPTQLKVELGSERQRTEELSRLIKQLQRDHDSKSAALNAQLQAEKQRSQSLQVSLQCMADTQVKELEGKVREVQSREQGLIGEVARLKKATASSQSQERVKELEAANFVLRERSKALEEQLESNKKSAVWPM